METATDLLGSIVDLRARGMRGPLPLPCQTAEAWASRTWRKQNPRTAARDCWETAFKFDKEDRDTAHRRVFGGIVPFDRLLDERPADDECGPGWSDEEATRFGRLARRLWYPLLEREVWR